MCVRETATTDEKQEEMETVSMKLADIEDCFTAVGSDPKTSLTAENNEKMRLMELPLNSFARCFNPEQPFVENFTNAIFSEVVGNGAEVETKTPALVSPFHSIQHQSNEEVNEKK